MQYVAPAFSAPVGHLRAKACWVTQQYADIRFAAGRGRGPSFQQLFQNTLGLLADPELPVLPQLLPCFHLSFRQCFWLLMPPVEGPVELIEVMS